MLTLNQVLLAAFITILTFINVKASTPYEKLKELKIDLKSDQKSINPFAVKAKRSGNLIFLSGHLSQKGDKIIKGKLGETMKTEQGTEAARIAAIELISTLHSYLGNLDDITQIIKLTGFVNSAPDFNESPLVINGASQIFLEIFEKKGEHARSAIPVVSLPYGAAVEVELIVEVKPKAKQ